MKIGAVIPAAGSGRRMGGVKKALLQLNGKPILQYSIDAFLNHSDIACIVVALSEDDANDPPAFVKHEKIVVVKGGGERADSVRAGVMALPNDVDVVIVHDAARPLVTRELIDRVLAALQGDTSATIAVPLSDTLHRANARTQIESTPDRSQFWRAQTPQAFPRAVLEKAFAGNPSASAATDEAGLVARFGWPVALVQGEEWNIKVTTPADIAVAEATLNSRGH